MDPDTLSASSPFPRVLGTYSGPEAGPLLICIGGIHGNEPAGVLAAQRVLEQLHTQRPPFRGEFVALAGNRTALARRCRYLAEDLNRVWFPERLATLRQAGNEEPLGPEETEQRELLLALEDALDRRRGPVIFLDLHTTSADGVPFTVISDTILNRQLALSLPAPVILGLEEQLDGTTLNYMNDCGYLAVGFEGGQNEAPSSVTHHEAAIWTLLVTAGCLPRSYASPLDPLHAVLRQKTRPAPRIVEIRYRHAIREGDHFEMEPGYVNFQAVQRDQLLAHDRHGDIRAQENGYVLMPLYQSQGTDGFFLVHEIQPLWLRVSAWLRWLRLDRVLPWLPGIRRHPQRPETLIVNPAIARWFVVEIFHLLGFRQQRTEEGKLVVSRRSHDVFSLTEWST
jgi:succinylglutamate desuccinylase